MTVTQFTDAVEIDGSQDTTQLKVQGHTTQTEPLQSWQDSTGDPQAQLTGDGRLQIGSFDGGMMATDDALIEAHRHESATTKPKRGLHLLGEVSGVLDNLVSWAVQELALKGTGGISALHTALRVRLTNENTGTMDSGADLRAADVELINNGGSSGSSVSEVTGLRVAVTNQADGYADTAYGLKVEINDAGSLDEAYAIHTGQGIVHLGDTLELKVFDPVPNDDPSSTSFIRLYATIENGSPRLYGKIAGQSPELIAGGGETVGTGEDGLFHAYDTAGGQTITTSWVPLTINTTGKMGNHYAFTPGGSEIIFSLACWYEITYYVSTDVTSGTNRSQTNVQLEEDIGSGFVPVPGSSATIYNRQANRGSTNASVTLLRHYQAGDKVRISAQKVGSDTIQTLANGVGLTISDATRTGPQGAKGETGTPGANGSGDDLPIGSVTAFAGATVPNGWLLCDGAAVSRTTYSALFNTIGTTYGAGDGSTTFNLPDLRGRTSIGTGQGAGLTNRSLGTKIGTETHTLVEEEMPRHRHGVRTTGGPTGGHQGFASTSNSTSNTMYAGNDAPHNNMQPSLVMNFIIKA